MHARHPGASLRVPPLLDVWTDAGARSSRGRGLERIGHGVMRYPLRAVWRRGLGFKIPAWLGHAEEVTRREFQSPLLSESNLLVYRASNIAGLRELSNTNAAPGCTRSLYQDKKTMSVVLDTGLLWRGATTLRVSCSFTYTIRYHQVR